MKHVLFSQFLLEVGEGHKVLANKVLFLEELANNGRTPVYAFFDINQFFYIYFMNSGSKQLFRTLS